MGFETLQDIIDGLEIKKNGLAQCIESIGERLSRAAGMQEFVFTHLQHEAFNKPGFWLRDTREVVQPHLIIQGATGSGKTLVSEMAIIECLNAQRSAIVLVPLKAMVRERREYLRKDLPEMKIYASSGDFQEDDDRIINGNYDVAVIVYEKFFAMLSQASARILENCSLLVVDELQMLSSIGRGPKLEFAIQKVMRHNAELGADEPNYDKKGREYPFTRIMCLTTCDCRVDSIKTWLETGGKTPVHICSDRRPVGLEEYVIHLDGFTRGRYIRGEQDKEKHDENFIETPEPLIVPSYDKNNREDEAKKILLTALLKKLYTQNKKYNEDRELKVLVFVSTRNKTENIARYIYSQHIIPTKTLSDDMNAVLNTYDSDDNQRLLRLLLQQQIAIHNASMSVALRDFVETEFQGGTTTALGMNVPSNGVNLVVATETLTVGMNMPVDVVILFDSKVPRGTQNFEPLTSQEYKNYVGRAGRLGQTNRVGKSYLFVTGHNSSTDLDKAMTQYINCSQEDITSALRAEQERVQAPYYLSLLSRGHIYTIDDLDKIKNSSFSKFCGGRNLKMEELCNELRQRGLCVAVDDNGDPIIDDEDMFGYTVCDLGALLAPYALSLSTVKTLRQKFLEGGAATCGKGGIPRNVTAKEIDEDVYLLDILYVLCTTTEIRSLSQLRLPPDDRKTEHNREAKNLVLKKFLSLTTKVEDTLEECQLWNNSRLETFRKDPFKMSNQDFQDVMRAILLWCWTKGMTIEEIRKTTNFRHVSLCTGDINRMAEVAAFQMEAVRACTSMNTPVEYTQESIRALYALSTRINYGMPRDLVIIANRHLFGLDRKSILTIGKTAKKYGYDKPVQFLEKATKEQLEEVITMQQRDDLLSRIDRIYIRDDIDALLDQILKNSRGTPISSIEVESLKRLARPDTVSEPEGKYEPLKPLEALFCGNDVIHFFQDGIYDSSSGIFGTLRFDMLNITLGIYNKKDYNAVNSRFLACGFDQINLLLARDEDAGVFSNLQQNNSTGMWSLCADDGSTLIDNISLSMTLTTFAGLLIQSVSLDDREAKRLRQFLRDCEGYFAPTSLSSLHNLLKNYGTMSETVQFGGNGIRILCDFRKGGEHDYYGQLFRELRRKQIPYRVLNWGNPLREEDITESLTLLCLTSESKKVSRSVMDFCTKLYKHHEYTSAVAVYDNWEQYCSWSGGTLYPENRIPHRETTDFHTIANYVWTHYQCWLARREMPQRRLIGISYSHTPRNGQERIAVVWFKRIVNQLNELYGEDRILFDDNACCKDLFDGNKAKIETLELYKQCSYFVILDDSDYLDGPTCPQEASTIKEVLKNMHSQHAWFLTPRNDKRSGCFGTDDFSHQLFYEEDSIDEIVKTIQRIIEQ